MVNKQLGQQILNSHRVYTILTNNARQRPFFSKHIENWLRSAYYLFFMFARNEKKEEEKNSCFGVTNYEFPIHLIGSIQADVSFRSKKREIERGKGERSISFIKIYVIFGALPFLLLTHAAYTSKSI